MRIATLSVAATLLAASLLPASASAAIPEGKVAVIHVTAVDGLAKWKGSVIENRSSAFRYDGTNVKIASSALNSLDRVQTLLLIDRRVDEVRENVMLRNHVQEVRAVSSDAFTVTDLPDRVLSYQVAVIGGNLRLLGDGDQILARGGDTGPYQVWKVTRVDIMDKSSIHFE